VVVAYGVEDIEQLGEYGCGEDLLRVGSADSVAVLPLDNPEDK